jgi:hypothetical protein
MTQEEIGDRAWLASILGFAVGPALAGLHETGMLSLGPPATFWPLISIVIGAMLGLSVATWVARRASVFVGIIVAGPNLLVLLFYGFFLAFFGMGGSR